MGRDGSATRDRLLRAGERVFARSGVGGASLREINAEAGQRNNSALHYHFGSRDGLLGAIGRKHQREIDAERIRLLDAQAAPHGSVGLGESIAIWVAPMAAKLRTDDGRDYLRILPALVHRLGGVVGVGAAGAGDEMDLPGLRRVFGAISAAMPSLTDEIAATRLIEASHFLAASLAARATELASGSSPLVDDAAYRTNLVAMLTGALSAPPAT